MTGHGERQDSLQRIAGDLAGGRFESAAHACREWLSEYGDDPRAWYFLSEAQSGNRRAAEAIAAAAEAISLQPDEPAWRVQLGKCLLQDGQRGAALAAAGDAAALDPGGAPILDGIGTLYSQLFEVERALEYFTRAATLQPANTFFLFNLATAQRMLGDIEVALQTCARVIELDPRHCGIRYLRTDLRRWTSVENHIAEMETLLCDGVRHWRDEMLLCFALGKECEDVGLYGNSFVYTERGCRLQRARLNYDVAADIDRIDRIITTHTREQLARCGPGFDNQEPIFIVGLPRSGTTLVERILSGHRQVFAAGELDTFARELARTARRGPESAAGSGDDPIDHDPDLDAAQLGRSYLAATRPRTGRTARFIDKMPRNYLHCGLIHAALPGARIIALDRDPMDACYAAWKALLSESYPFSFDLGELGRYYLAWRRLMEHWRSLLGDSLLTVKYEDLVTHPEKVSWKILEFCGLDLADVEIEIQRATGAITTASAVQARRPLHRESIGKWKHYRVPLQPLTALLRKAGIHTG